MTADTEPRRAVPELVALLHAMRPDWPPPLQLQGLIGNCASSGLSWAQVVTGLVRLAVDPGAQPAELLPGHADWRSTARRPGSQPTPEWRAAADKIRKDRA